jgi:hypothetical protein
MKKKIFFTGSVFQFYIPELAKYTFCKYFDFTHISPFHGLLAQVFDKFSDNIDNNIEELQTCDWLFGHRCMHKWPNLRNDTSWKALGILNSQNDELVPDFKGVQAFPYIVEDESKIGPWYPIYQLTKRGDNCEYEQVHHLETKILTTSLGLQRRAGMEYCRIKGLNAASYYDLEEEGTKYMYWQMINTPLYKDIPKELRGKKFSNY